MAILAALVLTALMLWFLDRFSPYSARNNKAAHPYPCRYIQNVHSYIYSLLRSVDLRILSNFREFTLKESFWFALTSFTPQGTFLDILPSMAFSNSLFISHFDAAPNAKISKSL